MKIIALSATFSIFCTQLAIAAQDCDVPFQAVDGSYQFVRERQADVSFGENSSIGEVYYTRLPIFDEANPEENNALFRWANRFHVLTRERTIGRQLLFERGQDFDIRLLQESSRLLRAQGYFYDADIRSINDCDGEVVVEVITKDNWSFTPSISFDRSGGENTYSFGLRDSNILGLGKQLGIASDKDADRRSKELLYEDNNVFGTRIRNRSSLIDSDDGATQLFDLRLPFYSLDSKSAWGIRLENRRRQDEQFFRGDDVSEVEHDIEEFTVEYGFSRGLQDNGARRWTIGYRYRNDEFGLGDELPPPLEFPLDKQLSYPFLNFESVEDNFTTAFNLDQIYRTEDLHLGHTFSNQLGYAAREFGSDRDWLVLNGFYSDTLLYDADMLWQHTLEWEALWNFDNSEAEDLIVSYETRYFRRQTTHRSFFASLEAVYSRNLNSYRQVVMGGLSGTRAFENRFQVGDRSVVLALEERIYTDIHLWNLVRVGGAIFVDVGRAWEPGEDNGVEDELLADVGFGLRLASSKAASGRIAHIDFAFPVTNRNDPDVDNFQISFTIKGSF